MLRSSRERYFFLAQECPVLFDPWAIPQSCGKRPSGKNDHENNTGLSCAIQHAPSLNNHSVLIQHPGFD